MSARIELLTIDPTSYTQPTVDMLPRPEVVLTDAEVNARFAELTEQVDAAITPAHERALDAVPTRKVPGSAEAHNMWKP